MQYKEQTRPLRIGFLGYDSRQTFYGMRKFAEEHKEDIDYCRSTRNEIVLNDGTCIFALLEYSNSLMEHRLDQVILFDDARWRIKLKKSGFIHFVLQNLMNRSCVPDKCMILHYEDN